MKKFLSFNNKLKPYKRLYKMFWMSFTIACLFVFQMLMLIFALFVPHVNSSFSYWFVGLHALLVNSRIEPRSAQGFIFAATIVGYIPIIFIIPFLYFTSANWYIQEKLSDKYIEVPKEKYLKWANFTHFGIIAAVFLIIPGFLSYLGGGGILPHQTWGAIINVFSDEFIGRFAGIAAILYYAIGCLFGLIVTFWAIGMLLGWIFKKIGEALEKWRNYRQKIKSERLEAKRASKVDAIDKKFSGKQGTDTTRFDTTDDF